MIFKFESYSSKIFITLSAMIIFAQTSFAAPETAKPAGGYPLLKDSLNNTFTGWVEIFEEKPLAEVKNCKLIFRRISLPAFKDSECVRIEFGQNKAKLTAKKKEKLIVGAKPQKIAVSQIALSKEEAESLKSSIDNIKQQFDKPSENNIGNDGVNYLYEIYEDGKHRYAERGSSTDADLNELNQKLASLTNRK
ncbi:MAG: hypothetical protein K2X81_18225 [Candidatus Obscuribacterales bacterium]|nr:hypothetical protein [Candidatus Obscuribacterales bacterium]